MKLRCVPPKAIDSWLPYVLACLMLVHPFELSASETQPAGYQPVAAEAAATSAVAETPVSGMPMPILMAAMRAKQRPKTDITTLAENLDRPWGMAFLPDGRLLVTQKSGTLTILAADGSSLVDSVAGVPAVASSGQGGLLDVAVDPDFSDDPWIYWTFSEAGSGIEAGLSGTSVARGRLSGDSLIDVAILYRQAPKLSGTGHFGARLAFGLDGMVFLTLGDRRATDLVQDTSTTIGKVLRINRDGSIPGDNPHWPGGQSAVWSYGHRNPQGAAIHPDTGQLWISEHGPRGGDEINRIVAGGNYGWPHVSYGCNYGEPIDADCALGGGVHAPDYLEPVSTWVPISTAPADLIFYSGALFPEWRGSILMAALAGRVIWRISLDGDREVAREALFGGLEERIRDIEEGPDGGIYLLTDSGRLFRVAPEPTP